MREAETLIKLRAWRAGFASSLGLSPCLLCLLLSEGDTGQAIHFLQPHFPHMEKWGGCQPRGIIVRRA